MTPWQRTTIYHASSGIGERYEVVSMRAGWMARALRPDGITEIEVARQPHDRLKDAQVWCEARAQEMRE